MIIYDRNAYPDITPNPGWNDLNLHGLRRSRQRILNLYLDIYILYSKELSCMKTYINHLYNYEAVCVCVGGWVGGPVMCASRRGGGGGGGVVENHKLYGFL